MRLSLIEYYVKLVMNKIGVIFASAIRDIPSSGLVKQPFTKKSLPPSGESVLSSDPYPTMPTIIPEPEAEPEHREKVSRYAPVSEEEVYELMAMVARS